MAFIKLGPIGDLFASSELGLYLTPTNAAQVDDSVIAGRLVNFIATGFIVLITQVEYDNIKLANNNALNIPLAAIPVTAFNALQPVESVVNTPPDDPFIVGKRYLIANSINGPWIGKKDYITWWDGTEWQFTTPTNGMILDVWLLGISLHYKGTYPSGSWDTPQSVLDGVTSNPDNLTNEEFALQLFLEEQNERQAADQDLQAQINNITTLTLPIAAGAVSVADSGNYYSSNNVELILQEIGLSLKNLNINLGNLQTLVNSIQIRLNSLISTSGNRIIFDIVNPTGSDGNVGDIWINKITTSFYYKTGTSTWTLEFTVLNLGIQNLDYNTTLPEEKGIYLTNSIVAKATLFPADAQGNIAQRVLINPLNKPGIYLDLTADGSTYGAMMGLSTAWDADNSVNVLAFNTRVQVPNALVNADVVNLGQLNTKEPLITGGTTAQYWRGDKTFQTLNTTIVPEGTNLYWNNNRTITSVLTGYSATPGTVSSTDQVIQAIQKLDGNISLLSGTIVFKGLWNASTNTPTLTSSVGTQGWMYKVSVGGTTTLDGITIWNVGDQAIFDGSTWDVLRGASVDVLSFNTRVGAITLASLDVTIALGFTPYNATNPTGYITASTTDTLTNKNLTSGSNTFPTFNQNTTGSSAKLTTARLLAGNSFDGSANTTFANKFIVQGTTDTGLTGAQFLGALGTGLLKNTTTTGVLSIATAGTDYGTVSSVALSLPSIFSVSGSPITGSGTLTGTLATQTANLIFAGPGSGIAAAPTFRSLVAADLPTSGVTAGSYTSANITVDASGRVTLAANGTGGGGTVTSVTGTTNRITSSGGSTPAIDISTSYIGQASITTVGTLSAGAIPYSLLTGSPPTWNQNTTGSAATLTTPRTINGVSFDGSSNITVNASAAGLTGITLNATVVNSSLTTIGTLVAGAVPYSLLTGTVPTWNQNTTGSAAILTTSRLLAGNSFNGSANVAFANKFIVQGTTDTGLTNAQFLGALGNGLVRNATGTGVLSIITYDGTNGIGAVGSNLGISGPLSADVGIDTNTHKFYLTDALGGSINDAFSWGAGAFLTQVGLTSSDHSFFNITPTALNLSTYVGGNVVNFSFVTSTSQATQGYNQTGGSLLLSFTSTGMTFFDTLYSAGVVYGGNYAAANASNPRWIPDKAYVDSVALAGGNPMTALGDTIYGATAGAATRLAGNTTTTVKFLTQTGTGSVSATPAWTDLFGTANTWSGVQSLGSSVATTQTTTDNSTKLATTAFVQANFTATAVYFSTALLAGAGTSGSPYTLATGAVGISNLSATGTADSTHFLRGDNTWAVPAGGGGSGTVTSIVVSTGLTGGTITTSGTIALDLTYTPTWTGSHKFTNNSVGTTVTPWLYVANETAATSGTTQLLSPALSLRAHYWTGSVDHTSDIMMYNQANNYGSYLTFAFSDGGGASTNLFQVSQYGDLVGFGNNSSGGITIEKSGMTATYNDGMRGFILQGLSAATSGVPVRWSPSLNYQAKVWNTSGTPASNYLEFNTEVRPVSSAAPTGALYFSSRVSTSGSGSFIDVGFIDSVGNLRFSTLITSPLSLSAINSTATATAAQVSTGVITSTSASATTITLPTATLMATQLFGAGRGTYFEFEIDNVSGANTVTVVAGSGMTTDSVVTGGTTLTITAGHAGRFSLYFNSTTAARLARII